MNAQLRSVSLNCLQLNLKKTKATFQCVIAEKKFLKAQNKNAMCSTQVPLCRDQEYVFIFFCHEFYQHQLYFEIIVNEGSGGSLKSNDIDEDIKEDTNIRTIH